LAAQKIGEQRSGPGQNKDQQCNKFRSQYGEVDYPSHIGAEWMTFLRYQQILFAKPKHMFVYQTSEGPMFLQACNMSRHFSLVSRDI